MTYLVDLWGWTVLFLAIATWPTAIILWLRSKDQYERGYTAGLGAGQRAGAAQTAHKVRQAAQAWGPRAEIAAVLAELEG